MIKAKTKQWVLFAVMSLLGGGLFIWLIWKEGPQEIVQNLLDFGLWPFLGFISLSLVNMCVLAWRWKLIIRSYQPGKHSISYWRVLLHRFGGFAFNYLTPVGHVGGEPVRIALLARDGVPVRQATSSTILDTAFDLFTFILFILLGLLLASSSGITTGNSIWLIFTAGGSVLLALLALFYFMMKGYGVLEWLIRSFKLDHIKIIGGACKEIVRVEHLMKIFLRGNQRLVFGIAAISVLSILIRVIEVWYLGYFLGVWMNFGQAFLTSTLPGVALLLPVPGGIGVFEGSFATVFALLGLSLNAVAFAILIRLRDILFIGVGLTHILMQGKAWIAQKLRKE